VCSGITSNEFVSASLDVLRVAMERDNNSNVCKSHLFRKHSSYFFEIFPTLSRLASLIDLILRRSYSVSITRPITYKSLLECSNRCILIFLFK